MEYVAKLMPSQNKDHRRAAVIALAVDSVCWLHECLTMYQQVLAEGCADMMCANLDKTLEYVTFLDVSFILKTSRCMQVSKIQSSQ